MDNPGASNLDKKHFLRVKNGHCQKGRMRCLSKNYKPLVFEDLKICFLVFFMENVGFKSILLPALFLCVHLLPDRLRLVGNSGLHHFPALHFQHLDFVEAKKGRHMVFVRFFSHLSLVAWNFNARFYLNLQGPMYILLHILHILTSC